MNDMKNKAPEKQLSDKGTVEALLKSLEQAIEAKKQNVEAIAHIREALAGRIDEMQQALKAADGSLRTTAKESDGKANASVVVCRLCSAISLRQWMMPVVIFFLLQVVFIAWYQGLLTPDTIEPNPLPSSELAMTEAEARLTRQAIELVRDDVVWGRLHTTDLTIQALSAELPEAVRDRVLKALGKPDMDFMRDALDILDGKIITEKEKR